VQCEFLLEPVAFLGVGCDGVLDVLESVSSVFLVPTRGRKGAYVESLGEHLARFDLTVFVAC